MLNFTTRKVFAITVILMAVILLVIGLNNFFSNDNSTTDEQVEETVNNFYHPLSGIGQAEGSNFFPVAVMIDNAADIPPQAGLSTALVVYEALAESNITRLLAIFDSSTKVSKIGPIRSARNYFMDWAEEYHGLYMHVGGSPQALAVIDDYDFINIDEMGASGIYFFRDDNLTIPHNVFTGSSDILRAGEIKKVANMDNTFKSWNFVDDLELNNPQDFSVNFSTDLYNIHWKYNDTLDIYQRFRQGEKSIDSAGEHLVADNIIVIIVNSKLIDVERRSMDTKTGGEAFIFNKAGEQIGRWEYVNGRTLFLDNQGEELKLVPGKTWIQVIDDPEKLVISE